MLGDNCMGKCMLRMGDTVVEFFKFKEQLHLNFQICEV